MIYGMTKIGHSPFRASVRSPVAISSIATTLTLTCPPQHILRYQSAVSTLRKAEDGEALTRTKEPDDAIGEDFPYFEEPSAALYNLGRLSNTTDTLLRVVVRAERRTSGQMAPLYQR
jgi:hypothetical protein